MNAYAATAGSRAAAWLLAALLAGAWAAPAAAQETIYKSQGKEGPIFSNIPSPGATPVELPPPNIVQVPGAPSQGKPSSSTPPVVYQSLVIESPADQGTIHSNTGAIGVRAQLQPALDSARGDVIQAAVDGRPVPRSFASTSFQIDQSDWAAASPASEEHTLQLSVVSRSGTVLLRSQPVSFYLHRTVSGEEGRGRR
jgi:hypothetical protein